MTPSALLRCAALLVPALLLVSCSNTVYGPVKLDEATGAYKTGTKLDEGGLQVQKLGVDLDKYRFVYLHTDTNLNPRQIGFFIRWALAREGLTRVYDTDELTYWVTNDAKFANIASITDPVAQKRLGQLIGPVLKVDYVARWNEVSQDITLTITDLATGEVLFRVKNARMIWSNVDTEAHYPVLNEFRRWIEDNKRALAAGRTT
jgi:hypothetical protein